MAENGIWAKLEDGWYALLDKIDPVLPVYRIVDPIDERIPSLALLLGIIGLLLIGLLVWPLLGGGNTNAVFTFKNDQGQPISGIQVEASYGERTESLTTNSLGNAVLKNVPMGTEVVVRANYPGFESLEETLKVTEANQKFSLTFSPLPQSARELTIQFTDTTGLSLSGKTLNVSLSCSNTEVRVNPATEVVTNGILRITPPTNCGSLIATVNANGYARKDSVVLSASNPIVQLEALQLPKGKVRARVQNEEGTFLENMEVELISEQGSTINQLTTNSLGGVTFNDVSIGEYYLSVSDPQNDYATATSDTVTVQEGETRTVDVTLTQSVRGIITVNVKKKSTSVAIPNALVKLVRKSDSKLITTKQTNSSGTNVQFSVSESGPFVIYGEAENYLSNSIETTAITGDVNLTLELEALTAQNSGIVRIKVRDEDNLPVDNAQVILYEAGSGFIAQLYSPKATDMNGMAKWTGVRAGSYFARVFKFPAGPSDSQPFTTQLSVATEKEVTLQIGVATVQVKVKDSQGSPIPFANVEFLTDGTDECLPGRCQTTADAQGIGTKPFKADRKIFVRVTANGFAPVTTLAYQLFPGATQTIDVKLETTITGSVPIIELARVIALPGGTTATELKAGRAYRIVYRVKIPNALVANEGGVHVRVGDEILLENDVMRIIGVNAPQTQIVKGTSYSSPNGWSADQINITFSDSKWANLVWNNLSSGVYEIGVDVRVNETVGLLAPLPVYYRVWAVKTNNEWVRAPADAVLGTAEQNGQKGNLYAETYSKIYHSGESIACEGEFCYTGEQLLNQTDSLYVVGPPYAISVNKNHQYEFVITSNTTAVYSNTRLRVYVNNGNSISPSDELTLTGYSITTPNGLTLTAQNLSTNDIPGGEGQGLQTGELRQYQTIAGQIRFLAEEVGNTTLLLQLINEGQIIFTKTIEMGISSSNSLSINVDPLTAAAFLPTTFNVHITDSQGFDIQDALVTLRRIDPSQSNQLIQSLYTDIQGKVIMIGPPSLPRTRLEFDAAKEGFSSTPVTIFVDDNVVEFEPEELSYSLPATPNASELQPLRIRNKTQTPLTLSQVQISGDFQGFLANGEMQNFVNQYANNFSLNALEEKSIQVKAATSSSVNPINSESLRGMLVMRFATAGTQQEWVQRVPINVGLDLAGNCDGTAIEFSGTPAAGTIQTTAFDNRSQTQFQASNVCEVDGTPFVLRNMKAKLVWKSNPIGNVELAMTDLEESQQAVEVLKNGAFVPLFDIFKTADSTPYAGILTFTPFPGNIGNTAEFEIEIAGEVPSQGNYRTVSKKFTVKIKITNLETCVKIDPEPEEGIVMESDEEEVEFEVDTTDCGQVPVDIAFCQGANNDNCSGGSPEGRLQLSRYTIQNMTAEKETVTVERIGSTLPGTYDITVHARVPGVQYRQIAALTTRIQSNDTYAFDLDKSQFTLYQQGAKDSATALNRLVVETVQVTASVCDWDEANRGGRLGNVGLAVGAGALAFVATAALLSETAILLGVCGSGIGCPLAAAIAVVLIILSLFDDPCDEMLTAPLQDYIINLAGGSTRNEPLEPDAIDIPLSSNINQNIQAQWNIQVSNIFKDGEEARQTVGIELENITGFTNPNPLFGVMTLRAREHFQGDISHSGNASVECNNSNFGQFQIGPTSDQGNCEPTSDSEIREEKFHIKIRTQDYNQTLPELEFDTVSCVSGSELGAAGIGALPKVAFNWSWNDVTGIPINACDALNGNYIYCDATQLNIVAMKRLRALDEFLAVNNYAFECPDNPLAQAQQANFPAVNTVPAEYVGFGSVGYQFLNPASIKFTADVNNLTMDTQSITLTVTPNTSATTNTPILPAACTITQSINANGFAHLECTISGFGISNQYYAEYALSSTTTTNLAYGQPIIHLSTLSVQQQTAGTCEDLPKSTAIVGGAPVINRWIDPTDPLFGQYVNEGSVTWTQTIPNIQALNNLLHFDTYLIRDGYSADFENDFREFYVNNSFADAPTWFKSIDPAAPVFSKYYSSNDDLVFTNKYFDSVTLPSAGKYHVDLDIEFGSEWKFFDGQGSPRAKARTVFYHLSNPSPNSPFYRMPFDGLVGVNGTQYDRVGYGLEYITENNPIKVNDSTVLTYPGGNSSALANLEVKLNEDIRKLNALPSTRGTLLEVTAPSGSGSQELIFSPSFATPIMLKVTSSITPTPFSAYYQIAQNGAPQQTGNTLTFWEGAGNCYDFSGLPVYQRFNYSPDRAGTPQDAITAWQLNYAVDWDRALTSGTEWLRTIFYTPAGSSYALQTTSSNAKVISANYSTESSVVPLDGISTLPYDNSSLFVDSMQDLFDLVGDKKVCVADSGVRARFFWNPETIYKQTSQTSIHAQTQGLVAGVSCLGAPPS